jgi:hypothetical protein
MAAASDDTALRDVVQEFSGAGTTTTALFTVQDRWEVRWNARQVVSVAVMSADGTIVAGAAGVLRGSLFVPLGGRYYLKVSDGTVPPSPPPAPTPNAPSAGATNAPPSTPTNVAPDVTPPPETAPEISWHLQVIQLGSSVDSNQALTVYTPFFIVPDSAVTPAPPPPPPPVLTSDQTQTLVTIKGDNEQGVGFLVRSPDGCFVAAQLHLLAANPNIKITTISGTSLTPLSLKGATDRDLALYTIQDDHLTCLPLPAEGKPNFAAGDQLIIPDIGAQSDVLLGKPGRVIGTNAERIDFDNAMGPGSSGAPVIHVKTGTALAIVTSEKHVDVSDRLAKAWPGNPPPGSADIIPYFGLRLTGVQGWETYDPDRFQTETLFLHQFHEETRALDSYLNGRRRRSRDGSDSGAPDSHFFTNSAKIREANDTYKQLATGADTNQRLEAARELLFDLQGIADIDLTNLQAMNHLYAYDQRWAQEEIAYRIAIKQELGEFGDNLSHFDSIARSR